MKIKKVIPVILPLLILFFTFSTNASAISAHEYGSTAKTSVKTTKNVKVYKVTAGKFEAANKFTYTGHIKKGTHLKVSNYFMSTGGYVIKNKHYRVTHKTFYLVPEMNGHWYKK
ncbi:hypothetical protein MOO46_03715 [Apilactobacillus apisilvae]|uniref:Surface layer protein A domain-containing protein n=1 Tax=Apilactobacillus apisilvae TaxID=2923364 RepID=A0ABY4PIP0_9LACO|nr:hypothetical protein [Apilactobacillus apisilvae]UQS85668.1 hypothetical protein MOO46_03715 [Apilactobacillus apisilvae]